MAKSEIERPPNDAGGIGAAFSGGAEATRRQSLAAFRRGMADVGYVEGQKFSIEARSRMRVAAR